MVCGTFTVSKVPQSEVTNRVNLWKATKPPPTSVTSNQDPDGTYTITAVFPPCSGNTTHTTDGSS
jgi:hypothetical protein